MGNLTPRCGHTEIKVRYSRGGAYVPWGRLVTSHGLNVDRSHAGVLARDAQAKLALIVTQICPSVHLSVCLSATA